MDVVGVGVAGFGGVMEAMITSVVDTKAWIDARDGCLRNRV